MKDRLSFLLNRIGERLWIKPLLMCLLSIAMVFLAHLADQTPLEQHVPEVSIDSIETLLAIIAASMLVIATFAAGSMVSAYALTSHITTPRSFSLVVSDDVSQNALSVFIGAFIFSIIALIAIKNEYYGTAGNFSLFVLTLVTFALVIITFVRWVDGIAHLGRLEETVAKVEKATHNAFQKRLMAPRLGGSTVKPLHENTTPIYADQIGYIQRVDIEKLQSAAEAAKLIIVVEALPGTFTAPGRKLAVISSKQNELSQLDITPILAAFLIGNDRKFDEDPRFGLIVLSEIASRALSPAVNDPGTAIDIIGRMVRLFSFWGEGHMQQPVKKPLFDRVQVPELLIQDMFDDAFTSLARDGAELIEVSLRLQKAFLALSTTQDPAIQKQSKTHAQMALERQEKALQSSYDLERIRACSKLI
ncbi:DUF2254 domain-containing protein [Hydrogenovibrio sp. 3SP14C1]|uniref:DUF2254 domain-containing protein n=1 Tax=Hydrogenovibrio sp. 3SP14C1 TaxID=3038774 RepID=UPI002418131B|nr:DUF2254 domain-containing protein [Hydrogenovibrio sp. 3SP14C1]MDG4812391.1 DUF2254 domain-containing protein [Hydrogenovibrio sp. 3SP14C1]